MSAATMRHATVARVALVARQAPCPRTLVPAAAVMQPLRPCSSATCFRRAALARPQRQQQAPAAARRSAAGAVRADGSGESKVRANQNRIDLRTDRSSAFPHVARLQFTQDKLGAPGAPTRSGLLSLAPAGALITCLPDSTCSPDTACLLPTAAQHGVWLQPQGCDPDWRGADWRRLCPLLRPAGTQLSH